MKLLCYGVRGWIGEKMKVILEKRGHTVVCGEQRLDQFAQLCAEIDTVKPDYVFSSIGRTHGTHTDGRVFTTFTTHNLLFQEQICNLTKTTSVTLYILTKKLD